MTGFEPVTCCLRNSCSTTELHRRAEAVQTQMNPGQLGRQGFQFRQKPLGSVRAITNSLTNYSRLGEPPRESR